jgi:hypothetical protein
VNGWTTGRKERRILEGQLAKLPNVALRESAVGMRDVFRSTVLVIVRSQVQDAFGRVGVEAGARRNLRDRKSYGGIPS